MRETQSGTGAAGAPSAPRTLEAANDRLRTALAEKEVLLREVQHRVKNNLQVVSSLMSLQARKAPAALKPFIQESLERVGAMGRVHEQLYRSDDASTFGAARADADHLRRTSARSTGPIGSGSPAGSRRRSRCSCRSMSRRRWR